jgi:phage terminase large subunit
VRQKATDAPLAFSGDQRKSAGVKDHKMREWYMDCRRFARDVPRVEGDKWQDMFWGALSGQHIDPSSKRMLALKACKGPGKSFILSVGAWWWLLTRWHANGVAMSITADNLRDNLWAELARVQERSQVAHPLLRPQG